MGIGRRSEDFNSYLANLDTSLYDSCQYKVFKNEGSQNMPKGKTQTKYRNAITGQYITKKEAEKHPKTTVKETDKIVIQKKPAPKKK